MAGEEVLQRREEPRAARVSRPAAAQAEEKQPPARCRAVRALGRLGLEPRHAHSGWAGVPAARRFALGSEGPGAQRRARPSRPEVARLVAQRRVPAARPEAAL